MQYKIINNSIWQLNVYKNNRLCTKCSIFAEMTVTEYAIGNVNFLSQDGRFIYFPKKNWINKK